MIDKKRKSHSQFEKALIYGPLIVFVAVVVIFALSLLSIFTGVRSICEEAKKEFHGDCVEALMALVESEKFGFREKNRAIRALGQIGDKRAIPLLEKLLTGEIQERPLDPDKYIVQYTVKKALKQCSGEFSLTRWMYRWL